MFDKFLVRQKNFSVLMTGSLVVSLLAGSSGVSASPVARGIAGSSEEMAEIGAPADAWTVVRQVENGKSIPGDAGDWEVRAVSPQTVEAPELIVPSLQYNHNGLFYDPEQVALVRANADLSPWNEALAALRAKADRYLGFVASPIRGPWSVPNFYKERAGQKEAVKPIEDSTNALIVLAQQYVFTGEEKYAARAVDIANAWTGSLMEIGDGQAVFEAHWELMVMAMAGEMIRDYPGWEPGQRQAFQDWLNERTWHLIPRNKSVNNHLYWMAAFAAAVGVFSEDDRLLQWAAEVYRTAINEDIAADGHMPKETRRGELGLFYQNFAIEPLVLIAEMARRQGIDLWEYSYQGKDLKLAIDYLFRYLDSPVDWPWDSKAQNMDFLAASQGGKKTGWFEIAYRYYKDPRFSKYLSERRPVFSRRTGGMTTLTHGLPLE